MSQTVLEERNLIRAERAIEKARRNVEQASELLARRQRELTRAELRKCRAVVVWQNWSLSEGRGPTCR